MREILQEIGTPRKLAAGTKLPIRRGPEFFACYLLSGCLTLREDTEDKVVDVSWPGDLTGTIPGVARAATDSVVLEMAEHPLMRAMAESRELATWVWQQQQQRTTSLARRIHWLSHCTVEHRILQTIINLDERASADQDRIIPLAQKEVADLAGVTREGTSTILNRLHRMGLVSLGRRRVVVEAPDALRTMLARQLQPAPPAAV